MDVGTITGDTLEVSKALNTIQADGPIRGMHWNIKKILILWPNFDPRRDADAVFPTDIGKTQIGVKLLGGPVSLDTQFCCNMILERVEKSIYLIHNIRKLQDPQCDLLVLRNCACVSKLPFFCYFDFF